MNILNIIPYVLESLSQGRILKRFYIILFQILGVIAALAMLTLIIMLLRRAFDMGVGAGIIGLLLSVVLAAGAVGFVQIFFYRAGTIRALPDSQFTIIPIIAIFFRVLGEVLAFAFILTLVTIILASIFAVFDRDSRYLIKDMGDSAAAGGSVGIVLLVGSVVIITFFYYIAEALTVAVDIAYNTKALRNFAGGITTMQASQAAGDNTVVQAPDTAGDATIVQAPEAANDNTTIQPPAETKDKGFCPQCGSAIADDDNFCMNCGHKL